jgi:hypothetical protein
MAHNVSQACEAQRIAERLEAEELAGLNAQPAYIQAKELTPKVEEKPGIIVDLSGICASFAASASAAKVADAPIEKLSEDSPNYVLNQPLRDLIAQVTGHVDVDSVEFNPVGTVSVRTTSGPAPSDGADDDGGDDWYVSGTYSVEITRNEDGTYTFTVTDPDGETHTFNSWDEAENYLKEQSEIMGGCIMVEFVGSYYVSGDGYVMGTSGIDARMGHVMVFKDGEMIGSFWGDGDNGVVLLSAREEAEEWIQNQHYNGAETTYTYYLYYDEETGTWTVTDADGDVHAFSSEEEAEEYLEQESREHDGCLLVIYDESGYVDEDGDVVGDERRADVYRNGEKVASFEATGDGIWPEDKAKQWIQDNYGGADLDYIYDYDGFDGLDENSSDYDVCGALGDEMDRTVDGYDERDFYYYDSNHDLIIDEQRMRDWYDKVRFLCGLLVALQMIMETKHTSRDLVQQEMIGLITDKGLDTGTIIGKYVQNRLAKASMVFTKLLEKAQEWNDAIYKREEAAANARNSGCGDATADFLSGGMVEIYKLEGLRDAAERYLRATSAILDLMRNANSRQADDGGANSNFDTARVNAALDDQEWMVFAELPNIAYTGEDGYTELDDGLLTALRRGINGIQSIRKAWNAINDAGAEGRNLVHEEMTGVGGREKSQNAKKLQQAQSSRATSLFETETSMVQQKISLKNNIHYLENQIEKANNSWWYNFFSNILSALAIVCSFIPVFGWIISLALGVVAGVLRLAGAYDSDSLSEEYEPETPDYSGEERDTDTGNVAVDSMNATANMEDKILEKIDAELLEQNEDDFYSVNTKAIADLARIMARVQNIRTAMVELHKERASQHKLMHMEMTGVGGAESDEFVGDAAAADSQQAMFKLSLLAFMLNELKSAKNIQVARDKALEQAWISFAITLGCQAASAGLGAGLASIGGSAASAGAEAAAGAATQGATQGTTQAVTQGATQAAAQAAGMTVQQAISLGWSIGGALGGLLSALIYQLVSGSLWSDYGDQKLPAYLQSLRRNNPNSTDARLNELEVEIFEELLANGIDTDVGDEGGRYSYWGLKSDVIAKLRAQLGRIAAIKDAMASVQSSGGDARNLVHMEMTGVSGRRGGELTQQVNQSEFEGAMKAFDNMVQYLNQRIEVQSRKVQAEKALMDAGIKFAIDAVIVAVFGGVGGAIPSASIMLDIMSPVMAISNGVYDFIVNAVRAYHRRAEVEQYKALQAAKESNNTNNPNSTMNKLDQMEAEIYMSVSKDLVEELGGGKWGVSSGAVALLRHKMEKIYNIKDALARLQASESEARAALHAVMTGVGGSISKAATAFNVTRAVALSNVATLFSKLRTIAERHNSMVDAERQMWKGLVSMCISAFSLWVSVESSQNTADMRKIDGNEMPGETDNLARAQHDLDVSQGRLQSAQSGGTVDGLTGEEAVAHVRAEIVPKQAKITVLSREYHDLQKANEKLGLISYITNMTETMLVWLTGIIFDEVSGDKDSKAKEYDSEVGRSDSGQGKGWAASVANSEADAVSSQIGAGVAELETEATSIFVQQSQEILEMLKSTSMSTINYIKSTLHKPNPLLVQGERLEDDQRLASIAAPAAAPQAPQQAPAVAPPPPAPAEGQPTPNTSALMQRLEAIMAEVDKRISQPTSTEAQPVAAEETAESLLDSVEMSGEERASIEELLDAARGRLAEAREHHTRAVAAYTEAQETSVTFKAETAAAVQDLDAAIGDLETALSQLLQAAGDDPSPETLANIQGLKAEIEYLEAAKTQLSQEMQDAGLLVSSAHGEVQAARTEVQQAARDVNQLLAIVERQGQGQGTLIQGAVAMIDTNPHKGGGRDRGDGWRQDAQTLSEFESAYAEGSGSSLMVSA